MCDHLDVADCVHVTADDRRLVATRDGVVCHCTRGGDGDRSGSADGHRNGGCHRQGIDDARIAELDRGGIDDRDAVTRAVRQAAGVANQVTAVSQDVAVPELMRRGKGDRVVCATHASGDVESGVVLQLDAELVDDHHLVGRAVDQPAAIARQRGVVGDDVTICEGMAGLQFDGEFVHHHDTVALTGHQPARVHQFVA